MSSLAMVRKHDHPRYTWARTVHRGDYTVSLWLNDGNREDSGYTPVCIQSGIHSAALKDTVHLAAGEYVYDHEDEGSFIVPRGSVGTVEQIRDRDCHHHLHRVVGVKFRFLPNPGLVYVQLKDLELIDRHLAEFAPATH